MPISKTITRFINGNESSITLTSGKSGMELSIDGQFVTKVSCDDSIPLTDELVLNSYIGFLEKEIEGMQVAISDLENEVEDLQNQLESGD